MAIRNLGFPGEIWTPICCLVACLALTAGIAAGSSGVRLSGRYAGMEEDRVGTQDHAAANGQGDARFHVTLDVGPARKTVTEVTLQSSDPNGLPTGSQVWDTRPGGYWILGVFRDGRQLNPSDQGIADPVSGRVEYDLYANPGDFKPGQHFRVSFRFADGGQAGTVVAVDIPRAKLEARYLEMFEDKVGPGAQGSGDGEPDARFGLTLDTQGARRVIQAIVLQSCDPNGMPAGGQRWDTEPGGYWILGTYLDGKRLNPADQDIARAVEGRAAFEVFASPGVFAPGSYFRASVRFAEGDEAVAVALVDLPHPRLRASYAGTQRDVVGEGDRATPDGRPDGEFSAVLDTGRVPRLVRQISLQSADAEGLPSGPERWDTQPGGYWILGVVRDGDRLNPSDRDITHVAQNGTQYRLFASRLGGFEPGTHYRIVVRFAEGDEAVAAVPIGAAAPSASAAAQAAPRPPLPPETRGGKPPSRPAEGAKPPRQEPTRAAPDLWRPATAAFDPDCKPGCREIAQVHDNHGARMAFLYNPALDDAIAQWGDCVYSVIRCLPENAQSLDSCVDESACPRPCRERFLDLARGASDKDRLFRIVDEVFLGAAAECAPTSPAP